MGIRIHAVMHESFEPPGAIQSWAESRGHIMTFSRVYDGEALPSGANLDAIDMLVVMGGPQSPEFTKEDCPYFDSQAEQRLIAHCVAGGKNVLGVCLGAQLLGAALGAPVERSPQKEIGSFPISLTEAGAADPLLASFGGGLSVGHWHGDMPGLTQDAVVLATSEGCPRQIVRYAPNAYGFQCHMEFTRELIGLMVDAGAEELRDCADMPFVQAPEQLRAYDYAEMNAALEGFLDAFVAAR